MAGKDFSIVAKMLMESAGFTSGKDKITKEAKSLERAVQGSNNIIKDSFSSLTNAALPALGGQFSALGGVVNNVKGVFGNLVGAAKTVRTALISTGIGAIIIVITTAIAGLIGWMKRTDQGGDTMRKVFDIIKAVINTVLEKITALGSAIVKVFKGDFKGAMQDAKTAVTGWGDAMRENIEIAKQLNETQDKLEDYDETYALRRAQIEERISELQAKARDEESYSAQERLAFTNKLKQANLELYNLNKGQKQLEIDALKQEIAMGANNQENRQKINDKEAELIGLRTTYNQGLKETIKLTNKLTDTAQAEKDALELAAKKKENTTIKIESSVKISIPKISKATTTQLAVMKTQMDELKESAISLKDVLGSAFESLNGTLMKGADSFKEYGKSVKAALKETIGAIIAEAVATMVGAALKDWSTKVPFGYIIAPAMAALAGGLAKTAFNSMIPSFATGGIMPHTGYALVGEQGAELVKMPRGSRIYNNMQTRNIFNNSGGTVEFIIRGSNLIGVQKNHLRGANGYR